MGSLEPSSLDVFSRVILSQQPGLPTPHNLLLAEIAVIMLTAFLQEINTELDSVQGEDKIIFLCVKLCQFLALLCRNEKMAMASKIFERFSSEFKAQIAIPEEKKKVKSRSASRKTNKRSPIIRKPLPHQFLTTLTTTLTTPSPLLPSIIYTLHSSKSITGGLFTQSLPPSILLSTLQSLLSPLSLPPQYTLSLCKILSSLCKQPSLHNKYNQYIYTALDRLGRDGREMTSMEVFCVVFMSFVDIVSEGRDGVIKDIVGGCAERIGLIVERRDNDGIVSRESKLYQSVFSNISSNLPNSLPALQLMYPQATTNKLLETITEEIIYRTIEDGEWKPFEMNAKSLSMVVYRIIKAHKK